MRSILIGMLVAAGFTWARRLLWQPPNRCGYQPSRSRDKSGNSGPQWRHLAVLPEEEEDDDDEEEIMNSRRVPKS